MIQEIRSGSYDFQPLFSLHISNSLTKPAGLDFYLVLWGHSTTIYVNQILKNFDPLPPWSGLAWTFYIRPPPLSTWTKSGQKPHYFWLTPLPLFCPRSCWRPVRLFGTLEYPPLCPYVIVKWPLSVLSCQCIGRSKRSLRGCTLTSIATSRNL